MCKPVMNVSEIYAGHTYAGNITCPPREHSPQGEGTGHARHSKPNPGVGYEPA